MQNSTDVAIIGGGVIGCSIAYYLAKLGIISTVFEQNRLGWGASGATAGVIGPLWHIPPSSEASFELGLLSLRMFPKQAAELADAGIDPEFRESGVLWIAQTEEHATELRHNLSWQTELDMGTVWLTQSEIFEREPDVNPNVLGGVYSPKEGYVRGQRLVDSLAHAASLLGANFVERTEVIGLETTDHSVTGVRLLDDVVAAGHVVLATGPWTGIARRWIPSVIPVRPVKGQRILLRAAGLLPKSPVHDESAYVVPRLDGNVLVAATRHEGEFDQEITADAVTRLIGNATAIFPALAKARFVGARSGVRPGSPDDIPIIGPVPGWDNLSVASGHDAVGIMLSPGTGLLMADYISTGDASPLEPFSLSRFDH